MERNPYYWAVDTAGNQLPYLDGVVMTLAENLEVLNLRAMAGEYDLQERHIDIGKLPVILENQQRGRYKVHLDLASNGSDAVYFFNQSYEADAEVAKWMRNVDFRRALSMALDRKQLNEAFWLGVAVPGSAAPGESLPYFPGPGWREKWSTFDQKMANEMLDKIGLSKKDAQGFRVRTDNGQRLRLQIQAVQAFLPWPKISEMVADQWGKVGIQADVRDTERTLAMTRSSNNEHQIMVWTNGGTELLYLFPRHAIPVEAAPSEAFMGPEHGKWFVSGGTQGKKPDDPQILKIFDLFRSAAGQKTEDRIKTAQEIWKIVIDQQYGIATVGQSSALMGVRLVSNRLGNIPSRNCIAQHCRTPGGAHPETWFYKN
jgi:peptide/nickel transport system substrate-binding protein